MSRSRPPWPWSNQALVGVGVTLGGKHDKTSFAFVDFLRTPGNRKRLAIIVSVGLFSQWSGNGLVSYYLNIVIDSIGITDPDQQLLINGALTSYNLVQNLFFSFFVDRWGRRPIILVSTVGMLVAYVFWTVLSARYAMAADASLGNGVLAMIFICELNCDPLDSKLLRLRSDPPGLDYLFYNLKSGLIASYTTEILPYNMRAKGYTIMEYALYSSLFFNQYVNPIALENISWRYYIFYCCFLAFELVVNWFIIVETRFVRPSRHILSDPNGLTLLALGTFRLKRLRSSLTGTMSQLSPVPKSPRVMGARRAQLSLSRRHELQSLSRSH